jgi:hypothetical protein
MFTMYKMIVYFTRLEFVMAYYKYGNHYMYQIDIKVRWLFQNFKEVLIYWKRDKIFSFDYEVAIIAKEKDVIGYFVVGFEFILSSAVSQSILKADLIELKAFKEWS